MAARHPKSARAKRAHGESQLLGKKPRDPDQGIQHLVATMKKEMKARGSTGFHGLRRRFQIMDDDGSKSLSMGEFKKALSEFNMALTEADLRKLFDFFDADEGGTIDFEEFVQGVRDPLSPPRLQLVHRAFRILDKDMSGEVDAEEIKERYDASQHPEVTMGTKTELEVLIEFLDTFDVGGVKDGIVTRQEFVNYYANLGASIDNDDYFELMIRNAWHMSGGEGNCANSANMRVLVTNSKGEERRVEIQNDLGLKKDDIQGMYDRLKAQGVKDIKGLQGKQLVINVDASGKEMVSVAGKAAGGLNTNQLDPPKVQRAPTFQRRGTGESSLSLSGSNKNKGSLASKVKQQMQYAQAAAEQEDQEVIVGNTLLDVLRVQLLTRGTGGIIELQRKFVEMDTDGSKSLDYAEFKAAILKDKLAFSESQLQSLFKYFDADGSGSIDYDELLYGLRGQLPPKLLVLVHQIFDLLDKQGVDAIDPQDLIVHYDASRHPEVLTRSRTEEEVMKEFLDTFDVGGIEEGKITRDEFVRYYTNISASINDDDYFETILRNVWHIQGSVTAEAMAAYKSHMRSAAKGGGAAARSKESSIAAKLRNAQRIDAATLHNQQPPAVPQRPRSAAAVPSGTSAAYARRPSPRVQFDAPSPRLQYGYGGGGGGGVGGGAYGSVQVIAPSSSSGSRPQSAGPMGRGGLRNPPPSRSSSTSTSRPEPTYSYDAADGPETLTSDGEVNEEAIFKEAKDLQKRAITDYNNQLFDDALEKFQDVLEVMLMLHPESHPECVKAQKSITMTQRKLSQY
mmetsp:Transcript_6765/g.11360  ORF Transcript_6765/g.11360 Transcript_6765/m.11360 type:complete len:793 (-) Transcript_6765:183-2561(-)